MGLLSDLVILVIPGLLRVSVCFGWLCFGGFLMLLCAVGSKCLWICLPRLWVWCLCGLVVGLWVFSDFGLVVGLMLIRLRVLPLGFGCLVGLSVVVVWVGCLGLMC